MRDPFEQKLKNRDSLLKIVLLLLVTGAVTWRFLTADFGQLSIDSGELLSLLLAFFAIALSVAFYFKATETSNTFYDNTYRFTKDISEILGRMEAGFGERLKHLDEGYAGLRESIAQSPREAKATTEEIKKEKEFAKALEDERNRMLSELADRAKLQEEERRKFFDSLKEKENELRRARTEVTRLKQKFATARETEAASPLQSFERLRRQVDRFMLGERQFSKLSLSAGQDDFSVIKDAFNRAKAHFPKSYVSDLKLLGYADNDEQLTDRGAVWLRGLVQARSMEPRSDSELR